MVRGTMKELKKVVQVVRRFAPETWGGTENVVLHLSQGLAAQGVASPVFCTAMLARPGADAVGGVPVRRFRYCFPWLGLTEEAKARLRLKGGSPLSLPLFFALLRERHVSVIHTHVQHRLGGMARTAALLKGIPYVVSLHGGHFTLPGEQIDQMMEPFKGKAEWGKLFGWLLGSRRVLNDAAAIVCVGQSEYDEVRRRFPFKNVFHVPNGVEVGRFAAADGALFRDRFGYASDEKIVLCVSRIDYQKNQLGLVRAFAAFAATHPDHRLALVGPATVEAYRDAVLAEAGRLGLGERVRLLGGLRPDDPLLVSAYKAAEFFVLPSLHEPFGIVVLEAWAAGLPVLASRVGGIPGFATDGVDIRLAEPGSEAELAARMAELADDGRLRTDLACRAFDEVAAHYDWPKATARLKEIYEFALNGRQTPRGRKSAQ